jgi:predicted ArsR family transcriptional regulator
MADAIVESARTHTAILAAVDDTAVVYGSAIAATARDHGTSADAALEIVVRVLTEHAYEPRRTDSTVILVNCPFQALAADHTDLICRLNHSLLAGFADSLAPDLLEARLERGENRCCVIVAGRTDDQQSRAIQVSARPHVR